MKTSERKIKKTMPFTDVPAFLRRLADAIENKTDHLPPEWTDLPAPITKLAVKGKARESAWEMKIRIKADPPAGVPTEAAADEPGRETPPSHERFDIKYKDLKKRMKSTFKAIGESLAAGQLPKPETIDEFLEDSERMTAFAGDKYGEAYYPAYRKACRQLAQGYAAQSWEDCKAAYETLDQLKKDCHDVHK